jgi:protein translocase subunit yidC
MTMQHNDEGNSKNIMLAMALMLAILFGWNYFYKPSDPTLEQAPTSLAQPLAPQLDSAAPSLETALEGQPRVTDATAPAVTPSKQTDQRVAIKTPTLEGSIRVQGARLDDLVLTQYKQELTPDSNNVTLLAPPHTAQPYFADFGWLSQDQNLKVPDTDTVWSIQGNATLTPQTPVTLTWDNGQGWLFERTIAVDEHYAFTIKDKVKNNSSTNAALHFFGQIARENIGKVSDFFILHEGPIGYLNNELVEIKYTDLAGKRQGYTSTGGWAGITDKYWLAALIPPQDLPVTVKYRQTMVGSTLRYIAEYVGPALLIKAGEANEYTTYFFAGPKELKILDGYETKLGIKHFDLAVDFGWFYFLTKPIFNLLTLAKEYLGNFGLGILLLTVILKLLFFPLANKSYRSMARMKKLQPKMQRLRELYQDDKIRMNTELMNLYKQEKVNPMAGCLPMLLQIPVFFALYKVLFVSIEMRHAPFYGWIKDLSAPDPTTIFNLFGLIPWTPPSFLMIGAWPLIMGVTMVLQQRLNPAPADPIQEKMFMIMPVIFTVMLANFPAGLVIYWAWNNVLTILQQWTIMRLEAKRAKP